MRGCIKGAGNTMNAILWTTVLQFPAIGEQNGFDFTPEQQGKHGISALLTLPA